MMNKTTQSCSTHGVFLVLAHYANFSKCAVLDELLLKNLNIKIFNYTYHFELDP